MIFFTFLLFAHTRDDANSHTTEPVPKKKLVLDLSREGYVTRVCVCAQVVLGIWGMIS